MRVRVDLNASSKLNFGLKFELYFEFYSEFDYYKNTKKILRYFRERERPLEGHPCERCGHARNLN